jgi:hypothetical protein
MIGGDTEQATSQMLWHRAHSPDASPLFAFLNPARVGQAKDQEIKISFNSLQKGAPSVSSKRDMFHFEGTLSSDSMPINRLKLSLRGGSPR